MAKRRTRLSAGELEVLDVLWRHGPVTLAAAHQNFGRPIGYTTVQTRLNRLVDKGMVKRSDQRPAQYRAAVAPEAVTAGHLDLLLERVSGGRVVPLVAHLVADRSLTAAEIGELKALIATAEKNLRSGKEKRP